MRERENRRAIYLCVGLALLVTRNEARTALHCTEPVIRLGDVRAGVPLGRTFELVNRGRETIGITGVQPSCGCLGLKLDRRRLGPGELATLRLEINTLTQPAGPQTWRIRVLFQEGAQPGELELSVAARVITEVTVEPAALVLYTSSPISSTVILRDRRPRPLTIIQAKATSPHVEVTFNALEREKNGAWAQAVRVQVRPECPEGRHEETLSLFTTDSDYRELRVPFTIVKHARPHVTPAPAEVSILVSPGQAPPARIVLLRAPGEEAVDIVSAEADHPAIRCTWARGPGAMATLKVAFDRSKLPAEGVRGTVQVSLCGPKAEKIAIPVACMPR